MMNNSQDWNINFPSSQEFLHRLSQTPSRAVLPPTPSVSSLQTNLSSSWCNRSQSQQTPRTQQMHQSINRESHLASDIRFALHAVLSVVRDLPDKLKQIVIKKSDNEKILAEDLQKLIEGKLAQVEKILSLAETAAENIEENRKFQESLHLCMTEIENNLNDHHRTFSSFEEKYTAGSDVRRKQLLMMKRVFLNEMKKLFRVFENQKRAVGTGIPKLEQQIRSLRDSVDNIPALLLKYSKDLENKLFAQEKENAEKIQMLNAEISTMKVYFEKMPDTISLAVKKAMEEHSSSSSSSVSILKPNMRVAESSVPIPITTKFPMHSPVAMVTPRVGKSSKETPALSASGMQNSEISRIRILTENENRFQRSRYVVDFESSSDDSPVLHQAKKLKSAADRHMQIGTPSCASSTAASTQEFSIKPWWNGNNFNQDKSKAKTDPWKTLMSDNEELVYISRPLSRPFRKL